MSHWNNFPACSFMTNFEIVVVPNERVQPERESLEQEELNAQPYNQLQDPHGIKQQQQISDTSDNPLLVNVLPNLGPEPFPDPLTPTSPIFTPGRNDNVIFSKHFFPLGKVLDNSFKVNIY